MRHPEADIRPWLEAHQSEVDAYTAQRIAEGYDRMPAVLDACSDLGTEAALDAGSGAGFDSFAIATHFDLVVAVDTSSKAIGEASRIAREAGVTNAEFTQGDATRNPDPGRFDFAWCNIMSHNAESRAVLTTALRTSLRDDGWLGYAEECEGYPSSEITSAIERRDAAELRVRLRQLANGVLGRPEFRFFLAGTFGELAQACGFEIAETTASDWHGLVTVESTRARAVRRADNGPAQGDYLTPPPRLHNMRDDDPLSVHLRMAAHVLGDALPACASFAERIRTRLGFTGAVDWDTVDELQAEFEHALERSASAR